jgi:60 kDa SS-A/Ro ribonucleoprotein
MQKLHTHYSSNKTPQTQPLTPDQVKMCSGGYGWEVDDWVRLDRFLVLGTEGGTYYVSERKLTREMAGAVLRCIQADGQRVVGRIVEISAAGRAPKNDPALFALAMAAKLGDEATRGKAYKALPRVARIGTHLFHFAEYAKAFGGLGGNGFKRALGRWYLDREASKLAYQAVKYQQRDGWSHRDLLRLAHPRAEADHQAVFEWIVKGWPQGHAGDVAQVPDALRIIWAFERAKVTTKVKEMVQLITDYRLPHECVPNELKGEARVWEALLQHMPVGAMIRNLNKMTAVGLLTNSSAATEQVCAKLGSQEALRRSRIHPMAVLCALKTYAQGRGMRGSLTWSPVRRIVDALDRAFYLAFGSVEPTGKRLCLALDVSGSMTVGVSSAPFLSCREAAAAMALVTANVEPSYEIVAFTCAGVENVKQALRKLFGRKSGRKGVSFGNHAGITPLAISPRQRLDDVVRATSNLPFGGTDCALPMRWAEATRTEVDAFIVYTDNESWAGEVHVDQALNDYRQRMGIPAKLVAVALSGHRFSVANPEDAGQMDVVGFDTATPDVISGFVRDEHPYR